MTSKQRRRLAFSITLVVAGGCVAALAGVALRDNIRYFYSPSDVAAKHVPLGVAFRIGGLVAQKSLHHETGMDIHFIVTDGKNAVPATYNGVLPALFREGQGVVALGALDGRGTFEATEVLAKHDEKYMPPEVVDALKRSGHWKEGG